MTFLNDITLGQYYPVESLVHKLDPRTKIIVILTAMLFFMIYHNILLLVIVTICIFCIAKIAHLPLLLIIRNLKPFFWLFLFTLLLHLFLSDQTGNIDYIELFGIKISKYGLMLGFIYSIRLAVFILLASLLTLTTSPMELTDALEHFLSPLKKIGISTHEFTLMITLSLRFIPTLIFEADKLKKAQISRGATFEGNLFQRVKSVIPLVLPLFISVFRRADELAMAMDARCYIGGTERTSFNKLVFKMDDYIVLMITIIGFVIAVYYKF